ncbi:lysine-rich nucleolar protein 1 isoform X2 [Symphalangus syndactylus]|uniref:lysine-rich nucleolar protein 1 isoform X2 n=1 Tax=Symphalangus syndactylus TaxID=9590 RepID=UPI003006E876
MWLGTCLGAAMAAVSTVTAFAGRLQPGRSRKPRGWAGDSKWTSGSRRSGLSRGGGEISPTGECQGALQAGRRGVWRLHQRKCAAEKMGKCGPPASLNPTPLVGVRPLRPEAAASRKFSRLRAGPGTPRNLSQSDDTEAWAHGSLGGMITKTHKVDPGLPEKKKKKKVVKEPETRYSVLNNDDYFADVSPIRATSPSKSVAHGQAPEMPLVKKKKKKKKGVSTLCKEHVEPETTLPARRTEKSPSPRKQVLGHLEFLSGEKKRKKSPLAMSHASGVKTSPDPRQGEEETRVGKKLKKHKKEKKGAQDPTAFLVQDPWVCEAREARDVGDTCSVGKKDEKQAALGQKRKRKSPREHNGKVKKKKLHQEGDVLPGHSKPSRSMESSPRKGSKKKPVKVEALEYIPETDTDLEVVLEKKGNMDEAHIDQVRRKALQEEIDRESGKTEASETRKWTGTQFGQWDTAGFENEDQKLKFLRLMGGFKNLSPSFSRPTSTIARPNMALGKKAADSLQQNLQRDYDRAMSWKYSRGAGLGFSTTPNKIFYIDRNASKSVKLED